MKRIAKYIIKRNEIRDGRRTFCYMSVADNGMITTAPTPVKHDYLMTKEQAKKFAKFYKAWFDENFETMSVELEVTRIDIAIKNYLEFMVERAESKAVATDDVVARTMKSFPAKKITSIPVHF